MLDDRGRGMAIKRIATELCQLIDGGFRDENALRALGRPAQRLIGKRTQGDRTKEPRSAAGLVDGSLSGFGHDAVSNNERLGVLVAIRLVLLDLAGDLVPRTLDLHVHLERILLEVKAVSIAGILNSA